MALQRSDLVDFAVKKIALYGFIPAEKAGIDWAGRDRLVAIVKKKINGSRFSASEIVDEAVERIWSEDADSSTASQKRLVLRRLAIYRGLILQTIREPIEEIEYDAIQQTDAGGEVLKDKLGDPIIKFVPKFKKVKRARDAAMFKILIEVEGMIAKVENIEDSGTREDRWKQLMGALMGKKPEEFEGTVVEAAALPEPAKVPVEASDDIPIDDASYKKE